MGTIAESCHSSRRWRQTRRGSEGVKLLSKKDESRSQRTFLFFFRKLTPHATAFEGENKKKAGCDVRTSRAVLITISRRRLL